jgi:hypothetical protein
MTCRFRPYVLPCRHGTSQPADRECGVLPPQPTTRDRTRKGSTTADCRDVAGTTRPSLHGLRRSLCAPPDGLRPPERHHEAISRDVRRRDAAADACTPRRSREMRCRLRELPPDSYVATASGPTECLAWELPASGSQACLVEGAGGVTRPMPRCPVCRLRRPIPAVRTGLDHRDPGQKRTEVTRMIGRAGTARILDEIAKCDIVCANCHRLRTFRRRSTATARE